MSKESARYIQVGEWVFEIKTVRALRVDQYGEPYSAIANCNINGNSMYVDGLLTKDEQEFSKEDFITFCKFGKKMGIENISYHRYQNGESVIKDVVLQPSKPIPERVEQPKQVEEIQQPEVPMRLVK